jgi:hypothetical protein
MWLFSGCGCPPQDHIPGLHAGHSRYLVGGDSLVTGSWNFRCYNNPGDWPKVYTTVGHPTDIMVYPVPSLSHALPDMILCDRRPRQMIILRINRLSLIDILWILNPHFVIYNWTIRLEYWWWFRQHFSSWSGTKTQDGCFIQWWCEFSTMNKGKRI